MSDPREKYTERELMELAVSLAEKSRAQNSDFIDYMLGLGVAISSPVNGAIIEDSPISVHGTYRVRPRPGDHVVLFGQGRDSTYYPQAAIVWRPTDRTWECPCLHLAASDKPKEYGIVVARVSEDLGVWLRSYSAVAKETGKWIGASMPTLPPGFEVLASITVTRSANKASPLRK